MNKESEIQQCQNILANIHEAKLGLASMQPDLIPVNFQLEDLLVTCDCDPWHFESKAEGIKDSHLDEAIKQAHNNYVALLAELKDRKGAILTLLLQKDEQ